MTADTITAIKKALEGVTPDQVERLWWFLHIISKSGGATDATDDKWNWINAFCHDFEEDTFNRAADLAFISVSFDSIMETSTAKMTPAGNAFTAYFDKAPSASVNAAIESLQRENEESQELASTFEAEANQLREVSIANRHRAEAAEAEVKRYRAALSEIATDEEYRILSAEEAQTVARTALSSTGDTHGN